MRCFVPATDDEIFALIERHGWQALVAYRCGMGIGIQGAESTPTMSSPPLERRLWNEAPASAPRQAA